LYYPDQSILFTAFNTNGGLYLNADELCTGLNLYKPLPVETYGYFFQTSASTDPNEVLEWICIWLDFTFGVPYFEGLPTNWPAPGHVANVPITVPLDGNYNHWVVVRGIHTDRDAWADYPDFPTITIKGFWINDPKTSNGLGSNTYVTADQFLSTYFKPIRIVGDSYINQYLALMDPPQDIQIDAQDTNVVVASTPAGFTTNQALVVAKTQTLIADKITVITAQNAVTNILKYDTTGLMQLFIDAQVQGRPSYVGDTICIIFRNLDVTFTVELSRTTGALRQFSVEGL